MGTATAPVLFDGIQIGTVTVGDDTEVSPDPLGENFAFGPAPSPDAFPQRRLGGDHSGHGPSRHLDPAARKRPAEKQPVFRHGVGPGSAATAKSDKPGHLTTADVAEKVHGKAESTFPNVTRGHLDRSRFESELKAKPWLRDKILRIAANEQGSNAEGTQAIIESMMNRAEVRGTNLEQQAKWHRSEHGYYQEGNMGRGALENKQHREVLEHSLSEALAGSNISNYATDNSSGNLAARERASGAFRPRSAYTGESFFSPGSAEPGHAQAYDKWLAQQQGASGGASSAGVAASEKPTGITRLPSAEAAASGSNTGGIPQSVIQHAKQVAMTRGPGAVQQFIAGKRLSYVWKLVRGVCCGYSLSLAAVRHHRILKSLRTGASGEKNPQSRLLVALLFVAVFRLVRPVVT